MRRVRPGDLRAMRAPVSGIAAEEAFADDAAWFAVDADAMGEPATAEGLRQIARTRRVAALEKRGRLAALLAAGGLDVSEA